MAKLAVIGAGPKGVALACKANVLRRLGLSDCDVTLFERNDIGSTWTGGNGYTDGRQRLCTPAEKDLGFPYSHFTFGAEAAETMMEGYSWSRYQSSRSAKHERFDEWLHRGRLPPTHGEFAAYLRWALERAEVAPIRAEVVNLMPDLNTWKLGAVDKARMSRTYGPYDGIVVTGPGPARALELRLQAPRTTGTGPPAGLYDGLDFWTRLHEVHSTLIYGPGRAEPLDSEGIDIAVIGSGGTAAAILAWLARSGYGMFSIALIAPQPTFFSRGDSLFENRMFTDDEQWRQLSVANKEAFFDRLNRGVVWSTVMSELARLESVRFIDAKALNVGQDEHAGSFSVSYEKDGRKSLSARCVINAAGFDDWWFLDLLPWGSRSALNSRRKRLPSGMDETLAFAEGWPYPRLHAPNHSLYIGPGYGSLLCLGDMADRVLSAY